MYVIEVNNLRKRFCRSLKRSLVYGTTDVLRGMAGMRKHDPQLRKGEFWALDNISFQLKQGESLGLIGANGCGKSTLLRMLSGIFPPDTGEIRIRGRMASLIAVGAGFHPHMSGAENVYLNGVLLGLNRAELKKCFDAIIDFAEIDDFIHAPVSTYSSGMRVKLGFAIAIHARPQILLVDEVMSVGDTRFRRKSALAMTHLLRNSGTSLLFVSHNAFAVRQQCDRAIVLDHGKMVYIGDLDLAFEEYYQVHRNAPAICEPGSVSSDFESFCVQSSKGRDIVCSDSKFIIEIGLSAEAVCEMDMPITITIFDEDDNPVVALQPPTIVIRPRRKLFFHVDGLPLKNGTYRLQCKLGSTSIQGASILQDYMLKVIGNARHSNTSVCLDLNPIASEKMLDRTTFFENGESFAVEP